MAQSGLNPDALVEPKVLCPHCWHEFYPDEAVYISRHPEFSHDDVLGDKPRRFAPGEVQKDRAGHVVDPKGWEMIERACPRCHLQIPPDLLHKRPYIISVVGPPRSGKTYFLTAMLYTLRRQLPKYFGYSLHDSDSHFVETFRRYENTLFCADDPNKLTMLEKTQEAGNLYSEVVLDGVSVRLPTPFIFSLRPTTANIDAPKLGESLRRNIVLYDNAGESFEFAKDSGEVRSTLHLAKCDAIIFAFDPLQEPETQRRLRASSHDPQLTMGIASRQDAILREMIHRMRRHRGVPEDRRLDVLFVVSVQKYDVWQELVPHNKSQDDEFGERVNIDHSSVEFVRERGIAGLDVEELNAVSLLVRTFLDDVCPEFVALAEASFRKVRYVPVSALGISPSREGDDAVAFLKVRPVDIRPFRVTDPLLWLLQQWRLIRRMKSNPKGAQRYPHARYESVERGQIRFVNPLTNRAMSLDDGYAGGTIIDPETGQRLWIPEAPTPASDPAPSLPPRSAPTPPSAVPGLSLDAKPQPRKKKGWFSR